MGKPVSTLDIAKVISLILTTVPRGLWEDASFAQMTEGNAKYGGSAVDDDRGYFSAHPESVELSTENGWVRWVSKRPTVDTWAEAYHRLGGDALPLPGTIRSPHIPIEHQIMVVRLRGKEGWYLYRWDYRNYPKPLRLAGPIESLELAKLTAEMME